MEKHFSITPAAARGLAIAVNELLEAHEGRIDRLRVEIKGDDEVVVVPILTAITTVSGGGGGGGSSTDHLE